MLLKTMINKKKEKQEEDDDDVFVALLICKRSSEDKWRHGQQSGPAVRHDGVREQQADNSTEPVTRCLTASQTIALIQ